MSKQYTTRSTSSNTAKVADIEISKTANTRKVLRSEIIERNPKNPDAGIKVSVVHQKINGGGYEDIKDKPLSSLKAGEMAKLSLSSEETLAVYNEMKNLYAIHSQKGVEYGETNLVVGRDDEIIRADSRRLEFIKRLLEQGHSEEVWEQLIEADPDLATKLSRARLHQSRQASLNQFSQMLTQQKAEQDWQDFFEENKWIFGYGLNYQILRTVTNQPNYGGERVTGRGKNKGDFLSATDGEIKFTVLVEIKKPSSILVDDKKYRNDAHCVGEDVLGGISQLRTNAHRWQIEGSTTSGNRDLLEDNGTYTVQPKKILVIGSTGQLNARPKRESFELFRKNQQDVEILTFDELLARAKFIVEHEQPPAEEVQDEDDWL